MEDIIVVSEGVDEAGGGRVVCIVRESGLGVAAAHLVDI